MLWSVLGWLLLGLVAGLIGRFLVPGPDPMSLLGTMMLGLVGSLVGGLGYNLVMGHEELLAPSGLVGSVVGAVVVVLIARWFRRPGE